MAVIDIDELTNVTWVGKTGLFRYICQAVASFTVDEDFIYFLTSCEVHGYMDLNEVTEPNLNTIVFSLSETIKIDEKEGRWMYMGAEYHKRNIDSLNELLYKILTHKLNK